jgi:hypothetical protein
MLPGSIKTMGLIKFLRSIDKGLDAMANDNSGGVDLTVSVENGGKANVKVNVSAEDEERDRKKKNDEDDKKKKKNNEDEDDESRKRREEEEKRRKRRREEQSTEEGKKKSEGKLSKKINVGAEIKGSLKLKDLELETDEILGRGVFHVTYKGQYQEDDIVLKKLTYPIEEDDYILQEIVEEARRRVKIAESKNAHIVESVGIVADHPNYGFATKYYGKGSLYDSLIIKKDKWEAKAMPKSLLKLLKLLRPSMLKARSTNLLPLVMF